MNILDAQDKLKGLTDQQLSAEMQSPTGVTPQFLVLSEINRRKTMRDSMNSQGQSGATVAEEVVSSAGLPQALASQMARSMAPKSSIEQNTGISSLMQAKQEPMPSEPQRMAGGGIVRMAGGGGTSGFVSYEAPPTSFLMDPSMQAAAASMGLRVGQLWAQMSPEEKKQRIDLDLTADTPVVAQESPSFMEQIRQAAQPEMEGYTAANPIKDMMAQTYEAGPFDGMLSGTPMDDLVPRTTPPAGPAMSYGDYLSAAGSGSRPTFDQLEKSLSSGALSDQQAADVQSMIDNPEYVPSDYELRAANAPGVTQTEEYKQTAEELTTPYALAKNAISDFVGGAFSGRTLGEQQAIDAERAAATRDRSLAEAYGQYADRALPEEDQTEVQTDAQPEAAAPAETAADVVSGAAPVMSGDGGGAGGGNGGGGSSSGAGGAGGATLSYEQELINALGRAEKRAQQDKWLALAQVGMAMMASKSPTLAGAIGEAGIAGLEGYRKSRDDYENERLGLTKSIAELRAQRAASVGRGRGGAGAGATNMKAVKDELGILKDQIKLKMDIMGVGDGMQMTEQQTATIAPELLRLDALTRMLTQGPAVDMTK